MIRLVFLIWNVLLYINNPPNILNVSTGVHTYPQTLHKISRVNLEEVHVITMIHLEPVQVGEHTFIGVEVKLPKTTLLTISNSRGYIMCGALDVGLLNERLADRKILAARAVGVKTLKELLEAPMESVTTEAELLGIKPGMPGYEALLKLV